jgi:hypothetical protein
MDTVKCQLGSWRQIVTLVLEASFYIFINIYLKTDNLQMLL